MKRLIALLTVCASGLFAQTVDTYPYLVFMSPANETPPIAGNTSSGIGTVLLHVVKDSSGTVTSATADLAVSYKLNAATNFTGFHIHSGAAGVAGPVLINSGLSGANPAAGALSGTISRPVQITSAATDAAALDAARGILTNPAGYYLNIHSTEFPGGLMRGQLMPATPLTLLTQMTGANENPPVATPGSALTTITALVARDGAKYVGGQVTFDINYTGVAAGTTITGLHIHKAPVGVNGPITIPTAVSAANPIVVPDAGSGNIHLTVDMTPDATTGENTAIRDLYQQPTGHYVNFHTPANPGGQARGQLRPTDMSVFKVTLSPANEVPPVTGIDASAPSQVIVYTARNTDGTAALASVLYDVDYRFPGDITFTGLHIHPAPAGTNGPVALDSSISSANPVVGTGGFGNIFRQFTVTTTAGLAAVNTLLANPENAYLNIHSTTNPSGVARSQLAAANTATPVVTGIATATQSRTSSTFAPGGLVVIQGTNLTKVAGDDSGTDGTTLPTSLNGTSVMIGGKPAAVIMISGTSIVAQVATDATIPTGGSVPVVVTNANGAGAAFNGTIAAVAPSIFFDGTGAAIAQKNADFSLVTASNALKTGDFVVFYGTGFGSVTPALATGILAPSTAPFASTQTVTATIGGQTAPVIYSILAPGFVGLNQIAVRVPAGLANGPQSVVFTIAGATSNPVTVAVQN